MTILDIDMGNTRTKWRLRHATRTQGAVDNAALATLPTLIQVPVTRICLASVADSRHIEQLIAIAREQWQCAPERATVTTLCHGLKNAYRQPECLGVDRWLAALAAWRQALAPCLIIDAGSAITIDTVSDEGVYLGGYIIPGWQMMQRVLVSDTGQINCDIGRALQEMVVKIPDNTAAAVQDGAAFAVCAITEKAIADFLASWPHGRVSITGGDGAGIAAAVRRAECYVPDLVLDGLAWALP